jgi:hypothetical protein
VCELLLFYGAELDKTDNTDMMPFHHAMTSFKVEVVHELQNLQFENLVLQPGAERMLWTDSVRGHIKHPLLKVRHKGQATPLELML